MLDQPLRVNSSSEIAFWSVLDPKLELELKVRPGGADELRPEELGAANPELELVLAPKLDEVAVTVPAPGVPCIAGSRL